MNALTMPFFPPKTEIYPKEYWSLLKAFCSFFITFNKLSVYRNKKKKILQRKKKYPKKQNCQTTHFEYAHENIPDLKKNNNF